MLGACAVQSPSCRLSMPRLSASCTALSGALVACLSGLAVLSAGPASAQAESAETGFFEALPEVLGVTRLTQAAEDTPGAVTVLDRDTIRRIGARDVAELLRLVPGYMVSGYNGANTNATYHLPLDDFGSRNLVLVDGRSVYSSFYLGGTHRGLMTVMVDDIERLEVLRGSNSAAYGANAMFGVINIVTRHTADTMGSQGSLSAGDDRLRDWRVVHGWGGPGASHRLSAGGRRDSGYRGVDDNRDLRALSYRGDFKPNAQDEWQWSAGYTDIVYQDGFPLNAGNPLRDVQWQEAHLAAQWQRVVARGVSHKLSASLDLESVRDVAPHGSLPVSLDYSGQGRRWDIEWSQQAPLSDTARAVWGLGWKRDEARSEALYARSGWFGDDDWRLFGNLEWRLQPQWLLNAGLLAGHHSRTGGYSAPRLALNWQPSDRHTWRWGVTRSMRNPSLFESSGDVRYFSGGVQVGRTVLARGQVEPEQLVSREIGYLGRWPEQRLTMDVRLFHERMTGSIETQTYTGVLPSLSITGTTATDYINDPGHRVKGLEYQIRWEPWAGGQWWLNQTLIQKKSLDADPRNYNPPARFASLAWFQRWPQDWSTTALWHYQGPMNWRTGSQPRNLLPDLQRLDLRLAKAFRQGATRGEWALTFQGVNGEQFVFDRRFTWGPRAHASLTLGW